MDEENSVLADPITETAREIFGYDYIYPWQRMIIASVTDAILFPGDQDDDRSNLREIAVLPTAAGKSLCWMLPAILQHGITVAVFPLLSLMADQERRLMEAGISCVMLRGGQSPQVRREVWKRIDRHEVKIILSNPEILMVETVREHLKRLKPEFLVVDETHTVSQWGESFRPACAELGGIVKLWQPKVVLALTATAGPQLRERIIQLLFNGAKPYEALAHPDREALHYGVLPTLSRTHLLERLVRESRRPTIVFSPTRSMACKAARILRERLSDERIRYYHAGLSREEKKRTEHWFLNSDDAVLTATSAYGLGVDKKNIRTVIHLAAPLSSEAYLQESGRASRDGKGANAWLIRTDDDLTRFIGPENESATDMERARRRGMLEYISSTDVCRREVLLRELGCEADDCSGCDVCGGGVWQEAPEQAAILSAMDKNRNRLRRGQLARVLIGRESDELKRTGLNHVPGFGILSGWELEDAEEALGVLLRSGKIRRDRRGRLALAGN